MLTRQGLRLKAFKEEIYLYRKTVKKLELETWKSKNK